ncbi:hypothetical protein [Pseudoalteromonas sp. MMG024]|uniref:hypothetical protein n=1 Tax=Pseudoalteromonas sp. MMG024 TaxID=2909980 RepID=UPI001F48EEE8|nr:hypothetical protein [Pseudoalteromonas sp. MMG024]MCF6459166.1 hypothetical protein [Pseudoalteromonas sp. MMG024]
MTSRSTYINERLHKYAKMESSVEVIWDYNWPIFRLYQGNKCIELDLPEIFCVLRHREELRQILRDIIKVKKTIKTEAVTDNAPKTLNRPELATEPNSLSGAIIEFDIDEPVYPPAKK